MEPAACRDSSMKCAVFAAIDGPLHEIKLSPGTLDRLGVAVYGTVLLGGRVPCRAGLEAELAEGAAFVHEWVLRHLGLADGQELVVKAADALVLPRALSVTLEEDASHRSEACRDGGPLQGQLQGLRALRRQLTGLPIFANALCAVQWLDRVRVLRVQDLQPHEAAAAAAPAAAPQAALIAEGTELALSAAPPQRAPCIASAPDVAELAHGDALLARMKRHLAARLPHAAASAGSGSGAAERLGALAAGGGHVLLSGPAGGGKAHTMQRLAAWARRAGVATRCASRLGSPCASSQRLQRAWGAV